ncbi:hypothetical protein IMSAGC015_02170 [Lachnospiraceae bacterium]|nr:hypothetical protein IMSAGC015_02170 [Lachnospiraceae bacterium]
MNMKMALSLEMMLRVIYFLIIPHRIEVLISMIIVKIIMTTNEENSKVRFIV